MKRYLSCIAFLFLSSSIAGAATIANQTLRVQVADNDGALIVTDLRTNQSWRQAIVTWRWEDGMDQPPVYWRRKNLWSVLYGAPPMYRMYAAVERRWQAQIAQTHKYVSDWVRDIAMDEMTSHRFLSPDRLAQETIFSSHRGVVVNFAARNFTLDDGQVVKAMDYVTFRIDGQRRIYTPSPGNVRQ